MLDLGSPGQPDIEDILSHNYKGEKLNAQQIMERWPALNVAPDVIGLYTQHSGVTEAKTALDILTKESLEMGATLLYDTKIVKADEKLCSVTDSKGKTHFAKQLVLSCGPQTPDFRPEGYFKT